MTSCGQILRERNRPFSQLVLRLNVSRSGPEALNQIVSKTGTSASPPRSSGHKLLLGGAALSVAQSCKDFYVRGDDAPKSGRTSAYLVFPDFGKSR
jgi:hypothetical protein